MTKRTIEGTVDARASGAQVTLNTPIATPQDSVPVEGLPALPPPFYYREVTHIQVRHAHAPNGFTRQGFQLIERVAEGGAWPQDMARFQGVGKLAAQTPDGMIERNYRFDIPAVSLEEAWRNFNDANGRAAANVEREFREQYAAVQRARANQLVVPQPNQTAALLGADGRPIG